MSTPAATRPAFHEEFFRRAQQFAQDTLALTPELECLAIIPAWELRQDALPFGVITGRDQTLTTPREVMHMAEQLHGALREVLQDSYTILQNVDARMAEMAEEIREKEARLAELDRALEDDAVESS